MQFRKISWNYFSSILGKKRNTDIKQRLRQIQIGLFCQQHCAVINQKIVQYVTTETFYKRKMVELSLINTET